MDVLSVINTLLSQGVVLNEKNGGLVASSSNGLSDSSRELIRNHKSKLLAYLVKSNEGDPQGRPKIRKKSGQAASPLSFGQQGLWLEDKMGKGAFYNVPLAFSLQGDFNASVFESAVRKLIERHDILRVNYFEKQNEVCQRLRFPIEFNLNKISLESLEPSAQEEKIKEIMQQEEVLPFDLSNDLMIRVSVLTVKSNVNVLLLTMQHIAFDGWSTNILLNELNVLYNSLLKNTVPELEPLEFQYSDYAAWQREWLQGEALERELEHWQTYLSDIPVLHSLPLKGLRPQLQTFIGQTYTRLLSAESSQNITQICRREGVTLYMFLQTAFSVLLSRYSNDTDIIMGTPIAGRSQKEIEPLIGFFVNVLALRTDLSGNPDFTTLLAKNKKNILQAFTHQHLPFEMLVEHLQPERSLSHSPIFQVLFTLINEQDGSAKLDDLINALALDNLVCEQVAFPYNISKFDLNLVVTESTEGLRFAWGYNTDLFSEDMITELAMSFNSLLDSLVAKPNTPLDTLLLSMNADHGAPESAGHVKVRGYNIDQSVIEKKLIENCAVVAAIVIVLKDELSKTHEQLVAFIVPEEQHSIIEGSVLVTQCKSLLEEYLPDYMVPDAIYALESVPRTLDGNVDITVLQELAAEKAPQSIYVEPRNEVEAKLSDIWKTLLRVEQVGVHDNFFELGGHSLTATRLLVQVRDHFEVDLPLKAIFGHVTIEKLAALVMQNNKALSIPPIEALSERNALPFSFAQQRLWYIDRLSGSTQYNQPSLLSLSGAFNTQAFEQALYSLVERHEALRTYFEEVEGNVYQRVLSPSEFVLKRVSLEQLDPETQKVEVQRLADEEAKLPFDLSRDLMIRASLLNLSAEEHVLLLTTHHIAFDGWSMGIFTQELNALYHAHSTGEPSQLESIQVQYADYAIWQRQWLQGEVLERQLGYWREHLAGIPAVHSLPLDKIRPAQQSSAGALHTQVLDIHFKEKIMTLCQQQDVTLFMFLQTSFSLLISRYSNEADIVMGTPIAGRTQQEVSSLIGFFVNTLVLRTDLSGNPGFTALLAQSKQRILDAYEYQHIPFEMLVEELQPERSLSYNPLFQISLTLENNDHGTLDFDGLRLQAMSSSLETALFDLSLLVVESPDGVELGWNYSTDLFSEETINQLAMSFNCLLESIIAEPEAPLDSLSLLTETQSQQLLLERNTTKADYPGHACLHELFEIHAENAPDAIAAVFAETQLSYAQLNEQANQLAHYLIRQGVKPNSLVGLCIERSMDMLIGILGILKAGGAYIPIDPNYPESRIEHVLQDTDLSIVLTDSELMSELDFSDLMVFPINSDMREHLLSRYSTANPEYNDHSSNQLAYVIYTSGSTGQPKGVMVTHQNVVGLAKDDSYVQINAEDVLAQASNVAFDAATFEIWGALCNGASIAYIEKETLLSPVELSAALEELSVSVIFVTTALFNQIAFTQPACFAGLKSVLFGGEQVNYDAVNRIIEAGQPGQLLHVYGPTEATTFSTSSELNGVYGDERTISIGTPLANVEVFVLDVQKGVLPSGAVGELYIGGRGIARGYLNQPELTSERFIENPFYDPKRTHSSAQLYRTGDLVRWKPNGELEFIGRVDHQVKVRGFRIELGEVEHQLFQCKEVKEAVVIALGDSSNKRLLAYIVANDEYEGKQSALKVACQSELEKNLPSYMVPSVYLVLPEFPLTANGKIDRKALPAMQDSDMQISEYVAPLNETQEKLCEIWQELLQVERVGIHDNFFKLGGHSLKATRLVVQVQEYFKVKLPLKVIFDKATVAEISESILFLTRISAMNLLEKQILESEVVIEGEI